MTRAAAMEVAQKSGGGLSGWFGRGATAAITAAQKHDELTEQQKEDLYALASSEEKAGALYSGMAASASEHPADWVMVQLSLRLNEARFALLDEHMQKMLMMTATTGTCDVQKRSQSMTAQIGLQSLSCHDTVTAGTLYPDLIQMQHVADDADRGDSGAADAKSDPFFHAVVSPCSDARRFLLKKWSSPSNLSLSQV